MQSQSSTEPKPKSKRPPKNHKVMKKIFEEKNLIILKVFWDDCKSKQYKARQI